jgi:hypothetical protein
LRRVLAITLLAVFGLPFASSLLALTPKSEATLAACCRRSGKHHCRMSLADRDKPMDHQPSFSAPLDKCPYCPAVAVGIHQPIKFSPSSEYAIYSDELSHPTAIAQTLCKLRIARDRARGQRGPPAIFIL